MVARQNERPQERTVGADPVLKWFKCVISDRLEKKDICIFFYML